MTLDRAFFWGCARNAVRIARLRRDQGFENDYVDMMDNACYWRARARGIMLP